MLLLFQGAQQNCKEGKIHLIPSALVPMHFPTSVALPDRTTQTMTPGEGDTFSTQGTCAYIQRHGPTTSTKVGVHKKNYTVYIVIHMHFDMICSKFFF